MTRERLSDDPVASAQIFFSNLFQDVRGGPLDDDIETARLLLETNQHLAALVSGGVEQPDGSTEAAYEFLSGMGFVSVDGSEISVNREEHVPQVCRIRYKEDGFEMDGSIDLIKWLVSFEVAGSPYDQIYLTVTGQAGHYEIGLFDPVPEYKRNLVLIGNNLSMAFNSRVLIDRVG